MFKKFMLVVASMAVIAIAYAIYQWQGETVPVVLQRELVQLPRPASPTATQADGARGPAIPIGPSWLSGGDAPLLRIYDKEGNTRIVFRATRWNPISDSEFDLLEATVRLTLPGGQLAYIWADEGRITVLQGKDNNPVAKRGRLQGNVRLFIDLTDESWREDHPDQADLDQHPESVVRLWLDHVRFDLDLSLLESDGPILLQSTPGDIEGRGLKIGWNERDRRIQQLTIAEGRRAVLRSSDVAGMSSSRSKEPEPATASAADEAPSDKQAEPATPTGDSAPTITRIMPPAKPGGLPYIELGAQPERAARPRIETYRLVFRDNVAATQKENGRVIGDLANADTLQLLFDFNQSRRRNMGRQASQPAGKMRATSPASAPALDRAQTGGAIELTWTGPLDVIPVTDRAGASPAISRMQLLIRGPAVQFHGRDGGAGEFPELEYHDETQRVWIRGSKDKPVALQPHEGRELIAHGVLSADLRKRTARVDGPGRFADRGKVGLAPAASAGRETIDFRNVEIAWEDSVDLEFARDEKVATASTPAVGVSLSPIPQGAYLKHAVLLGKAVFSDDRGSIRADKIDVVCGEPLKTGALSDPTSSMVVEHMTAIGHVVMTVANSDETVDTVECQHLEVEFGLNELGKSFPRQARAVGLVVARRTGRATKWGPGSVQDAVLREIIAQDGLVLDMVSVTSSLSPDDIAREEAEARARAKEQGIVEGSEQWKKHEERLRDSIRVTKTIANRLRASGGVTVLDLKQELDLAADSIDCELGRGREEIRKVLIVGSGDLPARLELGDYFIRGPRIDVDVETQSAEVPGAGTLRFMTRQDLDGRAVEKPIPVVLSWDKHMWLAGDRNTGRIVGNVRAVSETVILDCDDEMRLQFEDVARPASASRPSRQSGRWVFGMLADVINPPGRQPSDTQAGRQLRKRLESLEAVGNAVIEGRVRQEGTGRETVIERWLIVWNESLEKMLPADSFKRPTQPADRLTRLASRVLVKGPRVLIRLNEKQMMVEGGGHLLVEDYRLRRSPRAGQRAGAGGSLIDSTSVASLEALGPSQTLFTWVDSMSFSNSRNTAVFESGVEMRHLSGSKLIELERVASAIAVDPARVREYPGREASLNCDRFTVEFERDVKTAAGQPAPLSRATRLKGFSALGRQVRLEESGRFVEGVEVSFDSASQIGRVIGSPEFPARIRYLDERTGKPSFRSQVEQFEWDQRTGVIKVRDPQVLSTGR